MGMDLNVRAMRLHTAIEAALPDLACSVRVSRHAPATGSPVPLHTHPGALTLLVVTVALHHVVQAFTPRDVSLEERHKAHELVALEFWEEIAQHHILSIQLV
jgi:anti-sigma factor ChrR (cupin superfamily)